MTLDEPRAPRVPEVVDYFAEGWTAYLVMELIDATTPANSAYEKVADALQWLMRGGPARHRLFKDFEAPLLFSGKKALEVYMNRALECIPRGGRPAPISFVNDKVFFMLSEIDERNFLLDGNGKLCMVDFENMVLLPESFASFNRNGNPFAEKVADSLDWPRSANGYSMASVGAILQMTSDETFGLDNNGHRIKMPS
ncbi:hypothetical protein BD410DRAFT_902010 [Rickenella mellea]|uniref:Protein kinase domain-containing protein n=1 Tax=Rickenella mellea TaxID=50990 RepID=A0A4Y7PPH6_9AGAM|nr:hypothetical protein BD410DRAFT_902010 [Rickenella mellea]